MGDAGTLEILVQDAVQLPVVNHIGKQSPFCVLIVGGERKQTRTHTNGGRNPVWGERLSFRLEPGHSLTSLKAEVYHESKYGKGHVLVADATVPLSQALSSGRSETRRCKAGSSGEIRVQLTFARSQDVQRRSSSLGSSLGSLDPAAMRMQGRLSGADDALPDRLGSLQSQPSWMTAPANRVAMDGQPFWLSGAAPASTQPVGGWATSTHITQEGFAYPRPAYIEEGGPSSSLSSEASSLQLPQRDSTTLPEAGSSDNLDKPCKQGGSPTTSFRKRLKHKLLGSKHGGKEYASSPHKDGLIAIPSDVPEEDIKSGQASPNRLSGDGFPRTEASFGPLDSLAQGPPEQYLGEMPLGANQANGSTHSSGGMSFDPQASGTTPLNLHQSGGMQQDPHSSGGFYLEPVEGVGPSLSHTPAAESWQRHRLSEGAIPAARPGEASVSSQPHRQSADSVVESHFPGFHTGEGIVQNPTDSQNSYWRGGREVREWGQSFGNAPPVGNMPPAGFKYWPSAASAPLWDSERKLTSMQEVMHSASTTSFPLSVPQPSELSFSASLGGGLAPAVQPPSLTEPAVPSSQVRPAEAKSPLASDKSDSFRRLKKIDSARESAGRLQPPEPKGSGPATISEEIETSGPPSSLADAAQFGSEISHQGTDSEPGVPSWDAEQHDAQQNGGAGGGGDRRGAGGGSGLNMRRVEFDAALGTQGLSPQDAEAQPADGQCAQDVGSFKGVPSPFGKDDTPFEVDSIPSSSGDGDASVGKPLAAHSTPGQEDPPPVLRPSEGGNVGGEQEKSARRASETGTLGRSSETGSPSPQHSLPILDLDDWEIPAADLEISKDADGKEVKLGSGSFGTVYKGVYGGSTDVAIKTLPCEDLDQQNEALHEVAILRAQHHPNILQFLGACIGDGYIQLVTELMAGNLYTALRNKKCTWHKGGAGIAKNTASALAFLHKRRVVHLDVKSANILLTANNVAKLGDLGLSALMKGSFVNTIKGMGSFHWSSPELLMSTHQVGPWSDVYSYGTVLWEICTGEIPQRGRLRPVKEEEAPAEVAALAWRCLDADPEKRPSMQEIFTTLKGLETQPSSSSQ